MISMTLTSAGVAAIANPSTLTFTRMLAGSGTSLQNQIAQQKQVVPIVNSQVFVSGQQYMINGQQTTVNYNAIEITGQLSSTQATATYQWTELALMGKVGSGSEFTVAYGCTSNASFTVNPATPVTYIIPYTIAFDAADPSSVTVTTTASGVSYAQHYAHTQADVSSGAHGLKVTNGDLLHNGQSFGFLREAALKGVSGITIFCSSLPTPATSYLGSVAYNTTNSSTYRSTYTQTIAVGDYIVENSGEWTVADEDATGALQVIADPILPTSTQIALTTAQTHVADAAVGDYIIETDGVWSESTEDTDGALEVIADAIQPTSTQIALTTAQLHFVGWVAIGSLDNRVATLETRPVTDTALTARVTALESADTSITSRVTSLESTDTSITSRVVALEAVSHTQQVVTYNPFTWNSSWTSQMTGSGTVNDPYLIYTPYDFNQIRNNMAAHYKLMNCLDFTNVSDFVAIGDNGDGTCTTFTGSLDGNNKIIKNLSWICAVVYAGLFCCFNLTTSSIKNLGLLNSTLYSNYKDGSCGTGFFAGLMHSGTLENISIKNCSIIKATNGFAHYNARVAGLVGAAEMNASEINIKNCSLNFSVTAPSDGMGRTVSGVIAYANSRTTIQNCIVYANLDIGSTGSTGGIHGPSGDQPTVKNCVVVGTINGSALGNYNTSTSSNNYCLQGCATSYTGVTQKTTAELKSVGMITLLNAGLSEAVYTYKENNYPQLPIDVAVSGDIPTSMPLAVADLTAQKVYSSGITLGTLQNLQTTVSTQGTSVSSLQTDVSSLQTTVSTQGTSVSSLQTDVSSLQTTVSAQGTSIGSLQTDVTSKSTVSLVSATLATASWSNSAQTVSSSSVLSTSTLVIVPQNEDVFTYGIAISSQAAGSITFSCTSTPAADVAVSVLVIN